MRVSEAGTGAGAMTSRAGGVGERAMAAKNPKHEATSMRNAPLPRIAFWTGRLARKAALAKTSATTSAMMERVTHTVCDMMGSPYGLHEAARYYTLRSELTSRRPVYAPAGGALTAPRRRRAESSRAAIAVALGRHKAGLAHTALRQTE